MSDTFFLVVGIILAAIGILSIVCGIISVKKCTDETEGTVVSLKDRKFYHRGITTHQITPVIRYVYGGKAYESQAAASTSNKNKYRVGGNVTVFVNPGKPEEYRLGTEIFPYVFGLVTLIPGAVLIWCYFL